MKEGKSAGSKNFVLSSWRSGLTLKQRFSWSMLILCSGLFSQCSPPPEYPMLGPGQVLVHPGESVYSIAQKHKVSVRALIALNRLKSPYWLYKGQIILLPEEPGTSSGLGEEHRPLEPGPRLLSQEASKALEPSFGRWQDTAVLENTPVSSSPMVTKTFKTEHQSGAEPVDPRLIAEGRRNIPSKNQPSAASRPPLKTSSLIPVSKHKPSPPKPSPTLEPKKPASSAISHETSSSPSMFSLPVQGNIIRTFGQIAENGRKCQGIRISTHEGQPIKAMGNGVVFSVGHKKDSTHTIVAVLHDGGFLSAYGPLCKIMVKEGDRVTAKTILGYSKAGHLYFEVRKTYAPGKYRCLNPLQHVK